MRWTGFARKQIRKLQDTTRRNLFTSVKRVASANEPEKKGGCDIMLNVGEQ
jgi:hypothetical protein